ncbi:radical SAM protein [Vibrio metschnikovii]|uniref:radical SAM protein n=1 Tax=Vibrio metschnikovii TaxID=28172 RepID=UPI00165D311E|nr:radical SAM protein [Vibrio metschnikovii]
MMQQTFYNHSSTRVDINGQCMNGLSFKDFFNINQNVTIRINATNICNLHCTHCDNDAHLPFSKNGELLHRRSQLISKVSDINAFCELMTGIGEADPHILTGGEITTLPVATIETYIDMLHSFGRKIGMRTNGYNICGISPKKLQMLDRIYLNDHGINREAIDSSREYLDKHFHGNLILEESLKHRDLRSIVKHGQGTIEQALSCNHLLATLTLLPPVVLPCCNTWALMNSLNSDLMMTALINAGWTIHNPNLKETLRNWRTTLPKEFLQTYCADSCYMTRSDTFPTYDIQKHPKDRVLKRIPIVTIT